MPQLDDEKLEKSLKGVRIPPQPRVLLDLQQLQQRAGGAELSKMGALISRDVALSANVLKTVNSPFFGLSKRIDSIPHAVTLLGEKNIMNLVRGALIRRVLPGDNTTLERFWDTAIDIANLSLALANRLLYADADEFYTLGLFHDCGIAVMSQQFNDYKEMLKKNNNLCDKNVTLIEDEHYNVNHAMVGYFLTKSWNISPTITQVILMHHAIDPLFLNGKENEARNRMMAILKLSSHLSHNFHRIADDLEWEHIAPAVLAYLGLNYDDYEDLRVETGTLLDGVAA